MSSITEEDFPCQSFFLCIHLCQQDEISKDDLPVRLTGSVPHALGLQTALMRRASFVDLEREYILLAWSGARARKKMLLTS